MRRKQKLDKTVSDLVPLIVSLGITSSILDITLKSLREDEDELDELKELLKEYLKENEK